MTDRVRDSRGIDTVKEPVTILVLGSQSVLGSYVEDYLPEYASYSRELDFTVIPSESDQYGFDDPVLDLGAAVEGPIGEDSLFDRSFSVYAQAVGPETAEVYMPAGWRDRLVEYESPNLPRDMRILCPDPADLCCTKLLRMENKDKGYVNAMIEEGIISLAVLRERMPLIPLGEYVTQQHIDRALDYLSFFESSSVDE